MARAPRRTGYAVPSRLFSLPAPVGGLNFRDPIAALKPTDALILDNWFPDVGSVSLRRGYVAHATGLPGQVETLVEYAGAPGVRRLFAASAGGIYDVTSAGPVGAPVRAGLTNNFFQSVQFSTLDKDYLVLVNGADGVLTFDGTDWAVQTITGADATRFFQVASYQGRLWFAALGETKAYYLGTGAIAGAATAFDLGPIFTRGGSIALIVPLSLGSAGSGPMEVLAFISTQGEAAVYAGTDPASAQNWALSGRYTVGKMAARRGWMRYGGDCVLFTEGGVVSAMGVMRLPPSQSDLASFTDKINPKLGALRAVAPADPSWQMLEYPAGRMAFLNGPGDDGKRQQWVINTRTGAWCRFSGMEARCWSLFGEAPYFGDDGGTVYRADFGETDDGREIVGEIKGGFTDMKFPALKRFTMMRPLMTANGDPAPAVGLDIDYGDVPPSDILTASIAATPLWGEAIWGQDMWGASALISRPWIATTGVGVAAAFRMRTRTRGFRIELHAVDIIFEPAAGAALG